MLLPVKASFCTSWASALLNWLIGTTNSIWLLFSTSNPSRGASVTPRSPHSVKSQSAAETPRSPAPFGCGMSSKNARRRRAKRDRESGATSLAIQDDFTVDAELSRPKPQPPPTKAPAKEAAREPATEQATDQADRCWWIGYSWRGSRRVAQGVSTEARYDLSKTLIERLELAIQRWRKNRKSRCAGAIFSAFLTFGGISSGPKQFLGIAKDPELYRDTNQNEVQVSDMLDGVSFEDQVDFLAVAKGFVLEYFFYNAQFTYLESFSKVNWKLYLRWRRHCE